MRPVRAFRFREEKFYFTQISRISQILVSGCAAICEVCGICGICVRKSRSVYEKKPFCL